MWDDTRLSEGDRSVLGKKEENGFMSTIAYGGVVCVCMCVFFSSFY